MLHRPLYLLELYPTMLLFLPRNRTVKIAMSFVPVFNT